MRERIGNSYVEKWWTSWVRNVVVKMWAMPSVRLFTLTLDLLLISS